MVTKNCMSAVIYFTVKCMQAFLSKSFVDFQLIFIAIFVEIYLCHFILALFSNFLIIYLGLNFKRTSHYNCQLAVRLIN